MYYRGNTYYRGRLIQSFLVTHKYLKCGSNFSFFKTVLIFFQITSKNEGLSDVNRVYTSAYTLKSLPLLGSDFCIQIMESYLDKVLEMIKRGQIQIYTLKKKQKQMSTDSFVYIVETSWRYACAFNFIRTLKEFLTFYCSVINDNFRN